MARRTTSALVRGISDIPSSIDLDGFIDTATKIVDILVTMDSSASLDNQQLELIERWLTAHMVASTVSRESTAILKQIDITKVMWADNTKGSTGLRTTPYGLQALALDTTYKLEDIYGQRASTIWIGDDDPDAVVE